MPRFNYAPGDFDGRDISSEGISFDNDSGFSDTVENIETFTAPFQEPGEVWEITARLTLSADSGNGPTFLEIREEGNGAILARNGFEEFGGGTVEVSIILPTWAAIGEFDGPASSSGSCEIRVNNVAGSSYNYFVDMVAVRIRSPIDQSAIAQQNFVGSFDAGTVD